MTVIILNSKSWNREKPIRPSMVQVIQSPLPQHSMTCYRKIRIYIYGLPVESIIRAKNLTQFMGFGESHSAASELTTNRNRRVEISN